MDFNNNFINKYSKIYEMHNFPSRGTFLVTVYTNAPSHLL